MSTPSLFEIRLPAGDVLGFDIGPGGENPQTRRYNPADWLKAGKAGVNFIGQGQAATHIRPAPGIFTNIFVMQHPGIVRFTDLTLHNAPRSAIHFGTGLYTKGLPLYRQFRLELRGTFLDCNVPGTWGLFTYEADVDAQDHKVEAALLHQHPGYHHGYAHLGLHYQRCNFLSGGGEHIKCRPDATEVRPVTTGEILLEDIEATGWFGPDSDTGGAFFVGQATLAKKITCRRLRLFGGAGARSRCIMIDDGGGNGGMADADGFPNGDVIIDQVAAQGRSERTDYGDMLIRVGPLGARRYAARSVTIQRSSLWGPNMNVQLTGIPEGKLVVKDSNTPVLRDWAAGHGFDTTTEAKMARPGRLIPISEGLIA